MRIFDFIGQTFLFVIVMICLTMGADGFIFAAFIQFFMGAWQIISAIITTAHGKHGDPVRRVMIRTYWIAVGAYFVVLAALSVIEADIAIAWFFVAWLIAIYYYIITIRIAFKIGQARKTFLDIANE